jgi:hypothetical protein
MKLQHTARHRTMRCTIAHPVRATLDPMPLPLLSSEDARSRRADAGVRAGKAVHISSMNLRSEAFCSLQSEYSSIQCRTWLCQIHI